MELSSVKPGLSAAPMFMVHPNTGEMILPLGYTRKGQPIWPVMGGAPDDDEGKKDDDSDSDDDDDADEEDADEDSDDDGEDDEDEDDKANGKKKNPQAKIKALEEEKERHFRKAKKATKRAEAAEAALAAMKAKYESDDDDEDEDDNKGKKGKKSDKTPRMDDSKIKAAEAKAERLAIENTFLRVNDIKWIKPEQALALMMADDDYDIEFDDDGKVDRRALRAELKRFAKANPHLVQKAAPKKDDDADDEDDDAQRATASKMNGKRKGSKKGGKEMTREQLAKKFPALANRLG